MASAPESVAIRHRGAYDFETHYCSLCSLQDTVPLLEVKAHIGQGVLDINADKIRLADWTPILNTLRINKNLRFIAVRSYYAQSVSKDDSKKSHYFKRRSPAIIEKDLTLRLAQAIAECLKQTECLKCLDLQGVPFRLKDLKVLSKLLQQFYKEWTACPLHPIVSKPSSCGDLKNTGSTHKNVLFLDITTSLKHHPALTHINFTGCSLTRSSAETIAKLIKHQSTERHSEAWADSLRYRQPNLNNMTGLRRITLNHNPMIGDEGIHLISDVLKDDLWLKAVDLQKCGVGRDGASALLETLSQNKTLLVVDVRFNPLIDRNLLHSVIGQVLINSNGYDDKEFPWIKCEAPKDPYRTRPRRRGRQIRSSYGRKSLVRPIIKSSRLHSSLSHGNPGTEGFVPWRTAHRASQYKKAYTEGEMVGTPRYLQNPEKYQVSVQEETASSSEDEEEQPIKTSDLKSPKVPALQISQMQSGRSDKSKSPARTIRNLEVELVHAQRVIAEQRNARHLTEQRAMNLEIENIRLKKQLEEAKEASRIRSTLDDDALLDSMEASFNKFHEFLELLDKLGLGGLAAYAGVSSIKFPLPGNSSPRQQRAPDINRESRKKSASGNSPELSNSDDDAVIPPPITIQNRPVVGEAGDAGIGSNKTSK